MKSTSIINAKILVLSAILIEVTTLTRASGQSCELKSSRPEPGNIPQKIGHSANFKALVHAAGYLKYIDEGNSNGLDGYLTLEFDNYELQEPGNSKGGDRFLTLNADCAKINMTISSYKDDYGVFMMELALAELKNVPQELIPTKCKIYNTGIIQHSGTHYRHANTTHRCMAVNKLVAYLVFDFFEFELYGDPEKTSRNEFTNRVFA